MQQLFILKNVGKHIIGGISSIDTHTHTHSHLFPQKKIIGCPCTSIWAQNVEGYKGKHKKHASIYKQVPYEDLLRSGLTISVMKNCGGTREISGSANQTAQMEAYRMYTEERIPLPQRNKLRVPPSTTQQRTTE